MAELAIPTFASEKLSVVPWPDHVIDNLGMDPRSPYVERFWLSILGPSTTLLMRWMADSFDEHPSGFAMVIADTAGEMGLSDRGGKTSPFLRTVNRTVQFGLARYHAESQTLAVRRMMPPLARRQVVRLAPRLQAAHQRWQEAQRTATTPFRTPALPSSEHQPAS